MSSAGATLQGSFSGATGTIYETGFYYGTTSGSLDGQVTGDQCQGASASGDFAYTIESLAASTKYYYQAYVLEYNAATSAYVERRGAESSFTTAAPPAYVPTGWLELPAVTGSEDFVGEFYGSGAQTAANRNYSYNYSYSWYASLWVAYPLCGSHKSGSASTSTWRYNPNVPTSPVNRQVKVRTSDGSYTSMYGDDTYSRGHQCPNASRKSDSLMNVQTYYVTNQTPQRQDKFNASIWGALEAAVRDLVTYSTDTVYVVTGPAYRKAGGSESISYLTGAAGKNANPASLPIPNYYWKAILKVKRNGAGAVTSASAIGFWFDHRDYNAQDSYTNYVVSVDQIETWTGFDLFTNLSTALQATAEANTSWSAFQSF